jgi:hypothetical protein
MILNPLTEEKGQHSYNVLFAGREYILSTLSKPYRRSHRLDSAFQLQRFDVHDVNSIVSLPGSLSSPENKGKEGEKDVEKGKAEPTVDEACWIDIRAIEVCPVSCVFGTIDEPISRRLAQDLLPINHNSTIRMYTCVLSRKESRRMALSSCCSWK